MNTSGIWHFPEKPFVVSLRTSSYAFELMICFSFWDTIRGAMLGGRGLVLLMQWMQLQ